MNSQLQNMIVILLVLAALCYLAYRTKHKLAAKKSGCGGCDKCG